MKRKQKQRVGLIAREEVKIECERGKQVNVVKLRLCLSAEEGKDESVNKGTRDWGWEDEKISEGGF